MVSCATRTAGAAAARPKPTLDGPKSMTLDLQEQTLARSVARWIVQLDQCHQRFLGETSLFVIEGYPEKYWEITEPFELRVGAIDLTSGHKTSLLSLQVTGSGKRGVRSQQLTQGGYFDKVLGKFPARIFYHGTATSHSIFRCFLPCDL